MSAAIQLQADDVLNLRHIITHELPFSSAAEAFCLCGYGPDITIQVVSGFTN